MIEIKGVSEYIQEITGIINVRNSDKSKIVVYRGEPQKYDIPGKPGLYRERYVDKEAFFEKNLLNEMKVNRITVGNTYLECAVDAQHDEFPSRLLDVTYNALIALYFAVTPYYKRYEEDAFDDKHDAEVIIYFLPNMYCAGADNLDELFDKTVKREAEYLLHPLVQENYKLVDHIKMNTRICVQQGAFIMFQGNEYTPISPKDYEVIIIKREFRKKIREELDVFFGINTGFIYPEPYNLYATMGAKAYKIINTEINETTELNNFLCKVEEEVDYYFQKAIKVIGRDDGTFEEIKSKVVEIVMTIEHLLLKYNIEIRDFLEKYLEVDTIYYKERFNSIIDMYDDLYTSFETRYHITRSIKELKIDVDDK